MKKQILILAVLLITFQLSYAQWLQQSSGTNKNIRSVFFIDPSNGWAVGSNIILKTINGGTNWIKQPVDSTLHYNSVHFEDANHGWVCTGDGQILKYDGSTWINQYSGVSSWFEAIFFSDINHGWASGGAFAPHIRMVKTNNGGVVWDTLTNSNPNYSGNSLFFIDSLIGWKTNWNLKISKTTDGGVTWTVQNKSNNKWDTKTLRSIFFIDNNIGFSVGDSGTILKTIDGGANWIGQISGTYNNLFSICVLNSNTCYIVGRDGIILKTIDGGLNWLIQNSPTTKKLNSVFFPDIHTGYAVGDSGTILKISNANAIENLPNNNSFIYIYPNPTNDLITIEHTFIANNALIKIYNIHGQLLIEKLMQPYKTTIDISFLDKGVYIVRVIGVDKNVVKKIIKE